MPAIRTGSTAPGIGESISAGADELFDLGGGYAPPGGAKYTATVREVWRGELKKLDVSFPTRYRLMSVLTFLSW